MLTWPSLVTVSSVPTWIRSGPVTPPMPIHAASPDSETPLPPACGTVHDPLTAVKFPAGDMYPDQFVE